VSERISALGAQPVGGTSREFAAFIAPEIRKWEKVIRSAGVKLE
jgi:tripartite-type tricarboxylate transporter receptor subunit TctC